MKHSPKPKALPQNKALPKNNELPTLKPLPTLKKLPQLKSLPKLKALPKLITLPKFKKIEQLDESSSQHEYAEDTLSDDPFLIFDPNYSSSSGSAPPEKRKELAKPEKLLREGVLDLLINTVTHGDIRIISNDSMEILFLDKDTLLKNFYDSLMLPIFKQVSLFLQPRDWVKKSELEDMGFKVDVDIEELIVDLKIPARYRRLKTAQLNGNITKTKKIDVLPSQRSAYITPYWSRTWTDQRSVNNYVDIDAAINFDGWVIESDTTFDLLASKHKRNKTRLVRDFPKHVTRESIGDVEYQTIGLMGNKSLGGYSVSRDFSLQPNLLTSPMSHQRIFLENDSTVRVFVNDIPRQSFSLTAGYYDLQDFPLIDGVNFIKIEITDIFGNVTVHEYTGFDNKKVLVPGMTDYSLTTGFERIANADSSTEYDFGEVGYSTYIRHGLHKNYTVGLLSEGENNFLSFGGYGVATGLLGTIEASSMLSGRENNGTNVGAGLNINYYYATSLFTFNSTLLAKTSQFSSLGQTDFSVKQKYYASATLGLPVPYFRQWRQSYSGRYESRWNDSTQARASIKLNGRVTKDYTLGITAFYSVNENGVGRDQGVQLTLQWYPQKRISVAATHDSLTKGQRFDVSRSYIGEQGVALNGSFSDDETHSNANGSASWKAQYFESRYSLNVSQEKSTEQSLIQDEKRYESFSLSNSFAYVDGVYALGPPIRNGSFAIFKANEGLTTGRIAVSRNSNDENKDAMPFLEGNGSTLLFTNINQYGESTAHLLPFEEDTYIGLDKRKYRIFSRYRSGSLVRISKNLNMYGSGVLADNEWIPIGSITGTFYHLDSDAQSRFFTDNEGYFEIENIKPGNYRIILDSNMGAGTVTVEKSENNFVDFGILNLSNAN